MLYSTLLDAQAALADIVDSATRIVLIVDSAERSVATAMPGVTVLQIGFGGTDSDVACRWK